MLVLSRNLGKSTLVTLSSLILLVVFLACVSTSFQQPTIAVSKNAQYYSQLDANAQKFYVALQEMYNNGSLRLGNFEYDLIDKDVVSAEQARKYADGDNSLIRSFEMAKSAFIMDYNVFYVDFSKMGLSIGLRENKYVATLGTGRNKDYYSANFDSESSIISAVKEYQEKLQTLVDSVKSAGANNAEKIALVNTAIAKDVSFGYGISASSTTLDVASQTTTNYGALCNNVAVYEGFARLFRDVLNKLEIENILVNGFVLNNDENFVPAMWNYVKIDGTWYGVDVGLNVQSEDKTEYLLVGQNQMKLRHYPSGIISGNSLEFAYPELSKEKYGYVAEVSVLPVSASKFTLNVSYLSKNSTDLATQNKLYLAFRTSADEALNGTSSWSDWVAMSKVIGTEASNYSVSDKSKSTTLEVSDSVYYVQIAVLNAEPDDESGSFADLETTNFVSTSSEIVNSKVNSGPTAIKVTPSNAEILDADKTYTIIFEFDEPLKLVGSEEISIKVTPEHGTSTGTISNIIWNETTNSREVAFNFTASGLFCDNYQTYMFELENIKGQRSGKVPNSVSFDFQKFNINLSSMTQQITNSSSLVLNKNNNLDLSSWNYIDNDGNLQWANNALLNQLSFVSSTLPTDLRDQIITKITSNNSNLDLIDGSSIGYDIKLNLCCGVVNSMNGKMLKLETGLITQNVVYKAFVCSYNASDELDFESISEQTCYQQDGRLVIETNKMGALVLLACNSKSVSTLDRVLYINNITHNGVVSAKINGLLSRNDIISLKLDESVILEFTPNVDYKFDYCLINGVEREAQDNAIIISYNDLYSSNVLDVCFVANAVSNNEANIGLVNLSKSNLSHQYVSPGVNIGMWISIGISAIVVLALIILCIVVAVKNKKREKLEHRSLDI